jgi:hypothetical protein
VKKGKSTRVRFLSGALAAVAMAAPAMAQPQQQQQIAQKVTLLRNTANRTESGQYSSDILKSLLQGRNERNPKNSAAPYCQFTQCPSGCTHTQVCSGGGAQQG